MKIAKVDKKTDKIVSIIFEKTVAVPYQKQLELSKDSTFNNDVMQEGIKSIKQLKDIANDYHAKKVVAVATAAFRSAKNGPELAEAIHKETGVEVDIIDQKNEGVLAFLAATSGKHYDPQHSVVWDIGGGSLQLTMQEHPDLLFVYEGTLASIPFKNYIIQNIQGKNANDVHSPNPLTAEQMDMAMDYAAQVSQEVDPIVKEKIKDNSTVVLAAGNLFNRGIKKLTGGKDTVTRDELIAILKSRAGKSDEDINEGKMSEVVLSNGLLVAGFMKGLGIDRIHFVDINNADGALLDNALWTNE
jgi:exopolyphosphatase/guanosine-5'-triphosphate,3'-diphosphate pyrophosphatase